MTTTTNTRSEALRLAEIAKDAAATLRTLAQQSERDEALMRQALDVIETEFGIGGTRSYDPLAICEALRERLGELARKDGA